MLPAVLAVFHCFWWYYIFSVCQRKGYQCRVLSSCMLLTSHCLWCWRAA